MLAFAATRPVNVSTVLAGRTREFLALGPLNAHGWGAALITDTGTSPRVTHEAAPIHLSRAFGRVAETPAVAGLVHMRDATPPLSVSLANTHPFIDGDVVFAHNGSVETTALRRVLTADEQAVLVGDTDSEMYFQLIMRGLRAGAASRVALTRAVGLIQQSGAAWTSLNAVLLTPQSVIAVCAFDPAAPFETAFPGHFDLHVRAGRDFVGVVSSRWEGSPLLKLANRTVVEIHRDSLNVEIGGLGPDGQFTESFTPSLVAG
jgi:predicted glutamine amidotransferase